ncbi:MAG: DUF2782 domain-containing protein [Dokdonella sp.]|uniref:DUF2782 domain-containing protein n=1 Tax=Dokdonella sp. TaxID=2291710 RepID=UPI003F7D3EEA
MKPIVPFASVLFVALMGAAIAADRAPPKADVPPPPGMDEPGVTTAAPSAPAQDAAAPAPSDDPLAPLPKPDARLVRDKASRDKAATDERIARSEVTKRTQGEDTVEEYRQNGRIWMIRIIPVTGPSQTFMTNDGSGRLVRDPKEGPVSPVYYSLYEWK